MKRALTLLVAAFISATIHAQAPKAVLINGFRSNETSWKTDCDRKIAQVAGFLKSQGYQVFSFTAPVADLGEVGRAMYNANVLVYWGHGIIRNSRSCLNPSSFDVGGMHIDGKDVSPDDLRKHIRLAPGAWVFLPNSCYAAGNSSEDNGVLTEEIAQKRMIRYADAFFDIGASGMLSCADPLRFLQSRAKGKSVLEAYKAARYSGEVVRARAGQAGLWYLRSKHPKGHTFTSALVWDERP